VRSGRIGRLPIVRFSQANLRTYVTWKGEPAVLFLAARVSAPGLPGLALGAPYKSVRLRVRKGEVLAPGLGLSVRYRVAGTADPGELGRHELGIFESGGTKAIRIERGPSEWHAAELVGPARADLLLAFGFAPRGDPTLLYAPTASFLTKRPAPLG
jgi:hypothetical protein